MSGPSPRELCREQGFLIDPRANPSTSDSIPDELDHLETCLPDDSSGGISDDYDGVCELMMEEPGGDRHSDRYYFVSPDLNYPGNLHSPTSEEFSEVHATTDGFSYEDTTARTTEELNRHHNLCRTVNSSNATTGVYRYESHSVLTAQRCTEQELSTYQTAPELRHLSPQTFLPVFDQLPNEGYACVTKGERGSNGDYQRDLYINSSAISNTEPVLAGLLNWIKAEGTANFTLTSLAEGIRDLIQPQDDARRGMAFQTEMNEHNMERQEQMTDRATRNGALIGGGISLLVSLLVMIPQIWVMRKQIHQMQESLNLAREGLETQKKQLSGDLNLTPEEKEKLFRSFATDLTEQASRGELDPVFGRDRETAEIILKLTATRLSGADNPLLIGDPGVGKTVLAKSLAQTTLDGKVPEWLRQYRVYEIAPGALTAGTGVRGSLETKLRILVERAESNNEIFFMDELHNIIKAGQTQDGSSIDVAELLKPMLASNRGLMVGATTSPEYVARIATNPAFASRFGIVPVGPLDANTLQSARKKMLETILSRMQTQHGLTVDLSPTVWDALQSDLTGLENRDYMKLIAESAVIAGHRNQGNQGGVINLTAEDIVEAVQLKNAGRAIIGETPYEHTHLTSITTTAQAGGSPSTTAVASLATTAGGTTNANPTGGGGGGSGGGVPPNNAPRFQDDIRRATRLGDSYPGMEEARAMDGLREGMGEARRRDR